MKKVFVRFYLLLLSICLFTACGSDENNDVNNDKPEVNDGSVVINDNGTTSNGSRFTPIDDKNFYLDYIKYTIEEAHLIVSGYDKAAFSGAAKIESLIKFRGTNYDVLEIGNDAFKECTTLTSIAIPNSITTIGEYAFSGCKNLTSITIPCSIICIGKGAFGACTGLTSVHLADLTAWCKIKIANFSGSPFKYAKHLYINSEEIKDLVIPNNVTTIGDYVFAGCSGLTSVYIPSSVTSIGIRAFYHCYSLTSLNIPNSVTTIREGAFEYCSGLTSFNIPTGVTSIGSSAFGACSGLTSIILPNSIETIGYYAFEKCFSLTDVYCYAENVPSSDYRYNIIDSATISQVTLHVPAASVSLYQYSETWKYCGNIVALTDSDPKPMDGN